MTVTEMWKPIASLSTEDAKDVELRMSGGNIEVGHFSPVQRRWQIRTGNYSRDHEQQPGVTVHGQIYKLVEGVFPTHWRPLSSPLSRPQHRIDASEDEAKPVCVRCGARVHSPCETDAQEDRCELPPDTALSSHQGNCK